MNLEFDAICGGGHVSVELHDERYEAGAQGRVYRASLGNDHGYCVKTLPGFSPGAAATEVAAFSRLTRHIETSASKQALPFPVRKTLQAVMNKLPTHTCMSFLGGDKLNLLILRRYCEGTSLQRLAAPGAPIPPIGTRYEIARRLAGHLTALQIHGCVHLDPYPDNVFVDSNGVLEVALIDLEGMGAIARDSHGAFGRHQDSFAKEPGSYGKLGVWVLPPWYPRLPIDRNDRPRPFAGMYLAASSWQMLSIVMFVLTWGFKPLAWLEPDSFQMIANTSRNSSITGASVKAALDCHDEAAIIDFSARLEGNERLLRQLIQWFENSIVDPVSTPRAKQVQDCLADLCRL